MSVSSGRSIILRSFSASAAAFCGPSTTNGSPDAGARHALDEAAVDRAADAEREQVGLVEVLADEAEGLRLDADVAVGDDDDGARHALADRGDGVRSLKAAHQLGAAAAPLLEDHVDALADVFLGGRSRALGAPHVVGAGEAARC